MNNWKLISDEKWESEYKPYKDKTGQTLDFMNSDDVEEFLQQHKLSGYHVWSLVDGDDGVCLYMNGYHYCNHMGYAITKVAWKEDEEINTFSGGGYDCKIEQIHEDIECMEDCIKKGKDLDYYGETKDEQDEMKQMFLDDIEYCKDEIKNYKKLLEEEKLYEEVA